MKRLLEGKHPEKGHWLGEVTLLSVARAGMGSIAEPEQETVGESQVSPLAVANDPMQELRDLEEALEQYQAGGEYQAEGENVPEEEGWANDEEW